jgi:hypothetical protein
MSNVAPPTNDPEPPADNGVFTNWYHL